LAKNGLDVALVGRRRELLEETAQAIRNGGGRSLTIPADLAEADGPQRIVDGTVREFRQLDVLVNNAATIKVGPLETYSLADFDEHIATNVSSLRTASASTALRTVRSRRRFT
jgi:3-oxoacyl-[acyl-carrier protein] reductase